MDSVASVSDWPAVRREFGDWAAERRLGPVVECTHLPGVLVLVACEPPSSGRLLELEVAARLTFRGAQLATAEELSVLTELDARGFRRLRTGAEGLLLFAMRRTPWIGGHDGSSQGRATRLMLKDPSGAAAASRVLGRSGTIVRMGAGAALAGRSYLPWFTAWNTVVALRALRRPAVLAARIAFGLTWRRWCPLVAALEAGRRLPADSDRWLVEVARTHRVDGRYGAA